MGIRSFKRTAKLDEEGEHVSRYKGLRQPPLFDQTVRFTIHTENNATQYHVNASREQGRSDEGHDDNDPQQQA